MAREAGVSTGTVSNVLNAKAAVADATRAHVLGVIDRLGYRPRRSPRLFSESPPDGGQGAVTSKSVGVVVKEGGNPYYADIVTGVREALSEHDVLVSMSSSEGDYEAEGKLIDDYRLRDTEGIIVAPIVDETSDLSHLFSLKRAGYPFVLLEAVLGLRAPSVTIDNVAASETAVRHLLETGHERIAHIAGPPHSQHSWDRQVGVQRAFSRSAIPFCDSAVVPGGARLEDGYRAALDLFRDRSERGRPTGVTCFNDLVAVGVFRALSELGLRVPEDVSVVGFDDIQVAAYLSVPLTTIRVPKREMGRRAAELLLDQVRAVEAEGVELPASRRVEFDAELVVRASTRPL